MDDFPERVLIVGVDWFVKYEEIVVLAGVVDIAVLGDQLDAVDSNVDTQSWLAVPVEVRRLCHVGHVVSRLEVACAVKVFYDDVTGRGHLAGSYVQTRMLVSSQTTHCVICAFYVGKVN